MRIKCTHKAQEATSSATHFILTNGSTGLRWRRLDGPPQNDGRKKRWTSRIKALHWAWYDLFYTNAASVITRPPTHTRIRKNIYHIHTSIHSSTCTHTRMIRLLLAQANNDVHDMTHTRILYMYNLHMYTNVQSFTHSETVTQRKIWVYIIYYI